MVLIGRKRDGPVPGPATIGQQVSAGERARPADQELDPFQPEIRLRPSLAA
jgi:hypothetical protein